MIAQAASRLAGIAPDVAATARRFPFATLLLVLAAVVALLIANEVVDSPDFGPWPRLMIGLMLGALLAVAGVLWAEARGAGRTAAILASVLPALLIVGLFQIEDERFAVPWMLPVAALLILSLSPSFVRGAGSQEQQEVYWRANALAIPTGVFAGFVGLLAGLALFAMGWWLSRLFSIEIGWIFERYIYPVMAVLLVPLFWFSTLPKGEVNLQQVPGIGLVGQFVLVPFALVYALILHLYAVQIVIAGRLPDGVIGPMVLGFILTGHFTWLLVHPEYLRRAALVRFFRRVWFGLCVVPLLLFGWAVWVRLDAYGLTPSRVILLMFGLWAVVVTLAFLVSRGRADIRIIPGLAALILLAGSIGPLNPENLPRAQQTARLEALLAEAREGETFVWTARTQRAASAAFDYLAFHAKDRSILPDVLRRVLGPDAVPEGANLSAMRALVGLQRSIPGGPTPEFPERRTLSLEPGTPVDVAAYPHFLGAVSLTQSVRPVEVGELELRVEGARIGLSRNGVAIAEVDGEAWAMEQDVTTVTRPLMVLSGEAEAFALLVQDFSYMISVDDEGEVFEIQHLYGFLFAADAAL